MARKQRLSVRGLSALIANFSRLDDKVKNRFKILVKVTGEEVKQLSFELAPKDTQFMADHIKLRITESGLVFEVYLDPEDFARAGLPYYPPFVENGTLDSPEQPFLSPAFEAIAPYFKADAVKIWRDACRKAVKGK